MTVLTAVQIEKGHATHRLRLDLRFFEKKEVVGSCWEWKGKRNQPWRGKGGGYGVLQRFGSQIFAHRYAYQLIYGSIPPGMIVMHTCDNRPCIRPDHLRLGTHADNTLDMYRKGRGRQGTHARVH